MEFIQTLNPTAMMVLLAATAVIALVLFAKAIKVALKLAVIAVMLVFIFYFLRQAGII